MKIAVNLGRPDIEVLEHENLAGESQVHAADGPVVVSHIGLVDQKMAAAVQVAEDAPAEAHLSKKGAVDVGDMLLLRVNQNYALHAGKNLLYSRRRIVLWVGTKFEPYQWLACLA